VWLKVKGGVHFFISLPLSKGADDAQSFLGYVLSTKLSFRILFSSFTCTSVTGGIMKKRRHVVVA